MTYRLTSSIAIATALLIAGCATDSTVQTPGASTPPAGKPAVAPAPAEKPAAAPAPAKAQVASPAPAKAQVASPALLTPAEGAVVPTLSDGQKAYLALPRAERVKKFADPKFRPQMRALGYYPQPLELSWTNSAAVKAPVPNKVELFRATDGQCVFATNFTSDAAYGSILVDNLEIARPYEWKVTVGTASSTGHFTTEDIAPRLVRLPGVPNVRDLGGRVGLDGRRVKQGIVFRSAGLNDNASQTYYTPEELEKVNPGVAKRTHELTEGIAKWRAIEADIRTNALEVPIVPVSLSTNWTLFRPELNRTAFSTNAVPVLEKLASIPEEFMGAKAEPLVLKPGAAHKFEMASAKRPAIMMQEVESPDDGYIAISAGGDYWWEIRSNGEVALDLINVGNWRYPYTCSNYSVALPVRKGRNLVVATSFAGTGGWAWGWDVFKDNPSTLAANRARVLEKRREQVSGKVIKARIPGRNRLKGAALDYALNTMGIKSDIDLRSAGECWGMTGSPLGDTVKWFHYSSAAYGGMQTPFGKAAFTNVFNVFLDEKNYPIDFHCIAGQDRTGAVAFIINGLLGVEEEELFRDWESTGFWNPSPAFNHGRLFNYLYSGFNKWPGATINERLEAYVLSLGFTKDDIAKLREIMLEK